MMGIERQFMLLEMGNERLLKEMVASEKYWFEIKWDGTRSFITTEPEVLKGYHREREGFDIIDRAGRSLALQFPDLEEVAKSLPSGTRLDVELFVPANSQKKDAPTTRNRTSSSSGKTLAKLQPACAQVFDCLCWRGQALASQKIEVRKRTLSDGLTGSAYLKLVEPIEDPLAEWERIIKDNDEGLVAKRKESPYVFARSWLWQKIKNQIYRDDVPIIGITSGKREISSFILEGGDKVNCSLPLWEYDNLLKSIIISEENILAKDGTKGKKIAPGFYADIKFLAGSVNSLRFPILLKMHRKR